MRIPSYSLNATAFIQGVLGRFGYQLARVPREGTLERALQRLLADHGVETAVDIGAHEGRFGETLRRIGFAGRIVSFEPAPEVAGRLRQKVRPGWEAHQIAVSDVDGEAEFFQYAVFDELSSLHAPTSTGRRDWGMDSPTTVTVATRRLDSIAPELGLKPESTFVKIDAQGHELAVIDGGTRFLTRSVAVQVEVPMVAAYEGAANWLELLRAIDSLGFRLVGMFQLGYVRPPPLAPTEFDALFVRCR